MQKIELTIEDDAIASVFIEMLKKTSFVSIDNISGSLTIFVVVFFAQ